MKPDISTKVPKTSSTEPGDPAAKCVQGYEIYRLSMGELSPQEQERLTEHIKKCPTCEQLQKNIAASKQQLSVQLPEQVLLSNILEKRGNIGAPSDGPRWQKSWKMALASSLAFAAAAMGLWVFWPRPNTVRVKGGLDAVLTVERSGKILPDLPIHYQPGDRLQISFSPVRRGVIYLFLVQAQGQVSVIYPSEGETLLVEPLEPVKLRKSLVLDESTEPEGLILVILDQPNPQFIIEKLKNWIEENIHTPQWMTPDNDFKLPEAQVATWILSKKN